LAIVPTAGVRDHVTAVFVVPLMVDANVALWPPVRDVLPGDNAITTGTNVMLAVAVFVESSTLAAVSVIVWRLAIEAGAVYTPFTIVPTTGLSDQLTAVLPDPVTEAVNVAVVPTPSDTEAGPNVTPLGINDTVALAAFVESATLVAVTVTLCLIAMVAGAWYTPLAMVPTAGLRDQVTAVFAAPVTVGVNVALWPPVSELVPGDKLMATGIRLMVAVAVIAEFATLDAVSVIVWRLAIEAGAV
jgi:hypothetical protein